MPTNLVTRSIEWMLILVENTETPTDAEWDECLFLLASYRPNFAKVKVLVLTDGGGPTPAQRGRLSAVSEGQALRSAVVSDSMKVRFIVSSVALFLPELSSFRRIEIQDAYAHLRMDARERATAQKAIPEMSALLTASSRQRARAP
jgi:hypothetical protein